MNNHQKVSPIYETLGQPTPLMLVWPFDIAHILYAMAVRVGLLKDSMLASARFSRDLSALEKMSLGPWARRA
jgi:hypothetical protein